MQRAGEPTWLIVTANLQEAFWGRDIAESSDVRNFANRVASILDERPVAVLLQEVVAATAAGAARSLSEATGRPYEVAVRPGERAIRGRRRARQRAESNAILLDGSVVTLERAATVISRYGVADAAPDQPPRDQSHAVALVRDRRSGFLGALASVHFVTSGRFASEELAFAHKARWAGELASYLRSTFPAASLYVIGGDFNNRRCLQRTETVDCEPTPFWRTLTEAGFSDAVFEVHGGSDESLQAQHRKGDEIARRIDYIFVDGEVLDASHDVDYSADPGDPGFYSDHRFVWALVAATAAAGARPPQLTPDVAAPRAPSWWARIVEFLRRLFGLR